ncbi:DUF6153 family protein [Kribbella sp. CCNWLY201]
MASRGLLALCVALAVLVHHASAGSAVSSLHSPGHSMVAQVVLPQGGAAHLSMPQRADHDSGHGLGPCGSSGMQLCAAPSVDIVAAVPPSPAVPAWEGMLRPLRSTTVVGRTIARGPPDLSRLSVSRI